MALKRIEKEYQDIQKYISTNDDLHISISKNELNEFEWNVFILGPINSPYEGGLFEFHVTFPKDYPFKRFTVLLKTKIYHPNFSTKGDLCCALGFCGDNWSPACTFLKSAELIYSLLKDPHFYDECIDMEFKGLKFDDEFIKKAKEYTTKYAM